MTFTMFALFSFAQATPVQVKVENHSLGETAEQFFSESKEGVMLNACTTKDFGKVNRTIKKTAKEYCASLSNIRQRMVGGENGDYKAPRKRGLSAPVTQSAESEVDAPQPLRRSSEWANNSASLGSFPDASRVSRSSMQPIAARRADSVAP